MTHASPPTRHVVLLRGVNVGGVTVRSADLRACLEDAGLVDVRTVLASGNAIVTSPDDDVSAVRDVAESALRARYDRDVRVIVRTQADLAATAETCPYPSDSETHHAYVVLFVDQEAATAALGSALTAIRAAHETGAAADEAVATGDRVLYWWCPRGSTLSTLSTPVARSGDRAARSVLTTTRNLRTLLRLTTG